MTTREEFSTFRWGLNRQSFFRSLNWFRRNSYWKKREVKEILRFLDTLAPKRILDFGCNDGLVSDIFRKHTGAEVYGTDIDKGAMSRGEKIYPDLNFVSLTDIEKISLKFDVILMLHVLEHIPDYHKVLGSLSRLLAPNGKFIIIIPQERIRGDCNIHQIIFYSLQEKKLTNPHIRIIRKKDLQQIITEHGFTIDDFRYVNFLPPLSSRRFCWLTAWSLVTICGRVSENPARSQFDTLR